MGILINYGLKAGSPKVLLQETNFEIFQNRGEGELIGFSRQFFGEDPKIFSKKEKKIF